MNGSAVPFPIVVLGDSIQWGQGLLNDGTQKMAELVAAALVNKFPGLMPPQVFRFAQSGATISPPGTQVSAVTGFPQGEVPSTDGVPTVASQAAGSPNVLAATPINIQAASVQLVLLDGGINDVGVFRTILNPFSGTGAVSTAATALSGPMTALLTQVGSAYPNAVIAVTGYYPILSVLSDPVGLLFTVGLLADVPNVSLMAPNGWLAAQLSGNGDVNAVLLQIAAQCAAFRQVSDQALGSAVSQAVSAQQAAAAAGGASRFVSQGQAIQQFIFVPSPLTDINALFVGGSDGADEILPTSPALLWGFDPAPAGINTVVLSLVTTGGILGSIGGFLAGIGEILGGDLLGGLLTAVASGSVALSLAGASAAIVEVASIAGAVDEVVGPRVGVCGGDLHCNLASVGHPNIEGERLYANAVATQITPTFQQLEELGLIEIIGQVASGNCLIATAAFGTPEATEVARLRQLRDQFIAESTLAGRLYEAVSKDYYAFSPSVAARMRASPAFRDRVREFAVSPYLAFIRLLAAWMGQARGAEFAEALNNTLDATLEDLARFRVVADEVPAAAQEIGRLTIRSRGLRGSARDSGTYPGSLTELVDDLNAATEQHVGGSGEHLDVALLEPLKLYWELLRLRVTGQSTKTIQRTFASGVNRWLKHGVVLASKVSCPENDLIEVLRVACKLLPAGQVAGRAFKASLSRAGRRPKRGDNEES